MRYKITSLFFVFVLVFSSFGPVMAAETPVLGLSTEPFFGDTNRGFWSFPPVPAANLTTPESNDAGGDVPQLSLHLDPVYYWIGARKALESAPAMGTSEPLAGVVMGADAVSVRATETGHVLSTAGIGVVFVGADATRPMTMTVTATVNKGAEMVTIDCDKVAYPFEYAVMSFPRDYFPHVDATNPLVRVETDGAIFVLPTYIDPETQRIFVATTEFCDITDFNACLIPSLEKLKGKPNGPTSEFINAMKTYDEAAKWARATQATKEARDFLVCLALGAWAKDFVQEVNQNSAACVFGQITSSFIPGFGQVQSLADAIKYASEGKTVEFTFAAVGAIPGGKAVKVFALVGQGSNKALKVTTKMTGLQRWLVTKTGGVKIQLLTGDEKSGLLHLAVHRVDFENKMQRTFAQRGVTLFKGDQEFEKFLKIAVQKGDWALPYGETEGNFIYYRLKNYKFEGVSATVREDYYAVIVIGDNNNLKDCVVTAIPKSKEDVQKQMAQMLWPDWEKWTKKEWAAKWPTVVLTQ